MNLKLKIRGGSSSNSGSDSGWKSGFPKTCTGFWCCVKIWVLGCSELRFYGLSRLLQSVASMTRWDVDKKMIVLRLVLIIYSQYVPQGEDSAQ